MMARRSQGGAAMMKRVLLPLAIVFSGCGGATPTDSTESQLDIPPGQSSALSTAVLDALDASGASLYGQTWGASSDDALDGGWLLQSPPEEFWGQRYAALPIPAACSGNCDTDFGLRRCSVQSDCVDGGRCAEAPATVRAPGRAVQKLCMGHSDFMWNEMYQVMVSGQQFVDVTSLQPPDGRFLAAMRNAVTFLGNSSRTVQVRMLFGDFPVEGKVNSKTVLQQVTRDLPSSAPLSVYVGNYRSSDVPPSWNHSKIVAADGNVAIVGGENLWSQQYLGVDPVHDVSMRVRGSAAADAQRFANEQWTWTCNNMSWITWLTWSVWINSWNAGSIDSQCPAPYDLPDAVGPGVATVIGVGRLAGIDSTGSSNQSDTAILALVGAAQTSIRISQQDIGPPTLPTLNIALKQWPTDLFDQLTQAMARGVDVSIVVSNKDATAGGLGASVAGYSNGWSTDDVLAHIRDYATANGLTREQVCAHLHVAPLRFSDENTFPDGKVFPNHAKLVLVDEQAFFIGSQNLYQAGLTEFGYIVDDKRAASELVSGYWNHLWQYSAPHAAVCN
jgi:phosphatidylserine/phosphatidylglycerophosphate/cardiolipin synthase-like enzyme